MGSLLPGGWPAVMDRNKKLVLEGRRILTEVLDLQIPCPEDMLGSLASLPLEEAPDPEPPLFIDPVQDELWKNHRIEVPIMGLSVPPKRFLRISAQLYNHREQYVFLADKLKALLG